MRLDLGTSQASPKSTIGRELSKQYQTAGTPVTVRNIATVREGGMLRNGATLPKGVRIVPYNQRTVLVGGCSVCK